MTPEELFEALWHRDLVKLSDGLEPKEKAKELAKESFLVGFDLSEWSKDRGSSLPSR